jgi:lipopolysaccharide/colanic/teichoic acid biosynthesis glycosyltransferase
MILKRAIDVVASALGLIVLAIPMLLVAAWVRMDSAGPALYRQTRVGYKHRPFEILKYRTMRTDGGGVSLTVGEDARITRAGHALRKYKIDELPQLINVFMGQMSLVGPRPEVPEYASVYPDQALVWDSVRPGITDPTAIRFRNESALLAEADDPEAYYRDVLLPEKTAGYLEYAEKCSTWYDARILANTIWQVLRDPEGDA